MLLTVLVPTTGAALTTLAAVKADLGLTTTAQDDLLARAILDASQAVETYVGQPLTRQLYQEEVRGYGSLKLLLARTPVRAIESILYNGLLVPSTSYQADPDSGIVYREQGWPWTAGTEWDLEGHVVPESERPSFSVTYEAGYLLTSGDQGSFLTAGARTLPYDIERAAIETTKALYLTRNSDPTVTSRRIGDLAISYGTAGAGETGGLPPAAVGALTRYRRIK